MEKLVSKYVWEWPVRIVHWVNFLCIFTLIATGLYIGSPKTLALNPSRYVMGWVRFAHFVAGFIFSVSVASRIYWAFKGNEYANWRCFVPYLFREGRENMKGTFLFYTFFRTKPPHCVGHNAMAGSVYLFIFGFYLVMIATGFALYSQYAPGSILHGAFGWMNTLFTNQWLRLIHHGLMWVLVAFIINHVYSSWLMDVKEKNGGMSSIFGGCKSVPADGEH